MSSNENYLDGFTVELRQENGEWLQQKSEAPQRLHAAIEEQDE